MAETLYRFRWKVFLEQPELVEASQWAFQPAVVADGLGLKIVDVGVLPKLVEGELVKVQLDGLLRMDGEEGQRLGGKIVEFTELTDGEEASKPIAVADDAARPARPDARHFLQKRGVGGGQVYPFARPQLQGVAHGVAVVLPIGHIGVRGLVLLVAFARLFPARLELRIGGLIVVADTDVGFQLLVLLAGHSVESAEVVGRAVDTALRTVLVDGADLPRLQAEAQELGAVGGVGVERETLHPLAARGLIVIIRCLLTLIAPPLGTTGSEAVGGGKPRFLLHLARKVYQRDNNSGQRKEKGKHLAVGLVDDEQFGKSHKKIPFPSHWSGVGMGLVLDYIIMKCFNLDPFKAILSLLQCNCVPDWHTS